MTSQFAGPARLARAGIVAAAVLGLAAGAHVLGGGVLPGAATVGTLGALVLMTTTTLAGRRFTAGALGLGFGAGQLVLHEAFAFLAPGACAPTATAAAGGVGAHAMSLGLGQLGPAASSVGLGCGLDLAAPMAGAAHGDGAASAAMLLAHAAATAVTVLLIASGERTLMWLLAWLAPLREAPRRSGAAQVPRAAVPAPDANRRWRPRPEYLRASPRRGPPRVRAVATS